MIRIVAGAFAALLLVASPVMAQDIKTAIETDASAKNINMETATDAASDEALTTDLQAQIAAAAGVTNISELDDDQLAAAVGAIVGNNPNLTEKQVTALVRAASRSRTTDSGVAKIANAAAFRRPGLQQSIAAAAISVRPAATAVIRAAAVRGAVAGNEQDLNDNGIVEDEEVSPS